MKTIVFLIGSAGISGGTYVILQHAHDLQTKGYDITLACMHYKQYRLLKKHRTFWHPALLDLHIIPIDDIHHTIYDVAIFTWWRTVYYLPNVRAKNCVYFTQSIESNFYNPKDKKLIDFVNATYAFGLPLITEATWIKDFLDDKYNTQALLVRNGIRKETYKLSGPTIEPKNKLKLRVLVEGPLNLSFKNTQKTIELCAQVEEIELWLLTSSKIKKHPQVDRVFSCAPIEKVADIYRSCDVLVKLSYVEGMFAPPLEMFHCGGTCIVYDVTGHDEYITHGYNGLVIKTNHEDDVIKALSLLNTNRDYLHQLKQGALETAKRWISWRDASQKFETSLAQISSSHHDYSSSTYAHAVLETLNHYETRLRRILRLWKSTY